jgi:RHS repeat-associated protein
VTGNIGVAAGVSLTSVSIYDNGQYTQLSPVAGSFSKTLNLPKGTHIMKVFAQDQYGSTVASAPDVKIEVYPPPAGPSVLLHTPSTSTTLTPVGNSASIQVLGTVNNNNPDLPTTSFQLLDNGAVIYDSPDLTRIDRMVSLSAGATHRLRLRATNSANVEGLSNEVAITVSPALVPPTLSVSRNPATMTAGQSATVTWNSSNATSVSRVCTANGTGFTSSGTMSGTSGSETVTASSAWVNYPSTCTWTATGAGGSKQVVETMTTSPPAPPPTISVSRNPLTMIAGQNATVTWSTTNATSVSRVCTASGTGFTSNGNMSVVSGSETVTANAAWVNYPSSCTWTANGPGGSTQTTETMSTSASGAMPTVAFTSPANNAMILATNGSNALVTLSGTASAPSGSSIQSVQLWKGTSLIASNLSATFSTSATYGIGTHQFKLVVLDTANRTAEATLTVRVEAAISGNGAKFVSQSAPGNLRPGEPYDASVTMFNNGDTTWTAGTAYRLGARNPQDNRNWTTTARAYLPRSVAPGESVTFTLPIAAPQQVGTYNFQWQMVREDVQWFGELTPNVAVNVAAGAGPSASLSVTPNNSQADVAGYSVLTFTGSGSRSGGTLAKLELFQDSGTGFGSAIKTVTGSATSLGLSHSINAAPGVYFFKIRATDSTGARTDSAPVAINVAARSVLGLAKGVRSNAAGAPELVGWACEPGKANALNISLLVDAPTPESGGTVLGTVAANVATESDNAGVQSTCGTPGSAHHFVADLSAYLSQYAGRPLYAMATAVDGTTKITLACADNTCSMPGTERISLTTPLNGDRYRAPAQIFLRARITGASAPFDEVAFNFNGQWITASQDTSPDTWFASVSNVAARTEGYPVVAKFRKGSTTLMSVENLVFVDPASDITVALNAPVNGATVTAGAPVALSATLGGTTSTVAKVRFNAGGTVIDASGSGTSWTANWTPSGSGAMNITATAYDSLDRPLGSSIAVSVTVNPASGSSSAPVAVRAEPPAFGALAGSLPGELSVTNGGAASYSIPIDVPPGTAGVAPKLSLNYTSQGTNGLLGLGWSLGGTSAIHRCGKTIAQDQVNARISFSTNDRLCLDGQRLVLVKGGNDDASYWADSAEYRTEIDSFSRITAQGSGAARSFKVETKDGRVMTYGSSASSFETPVLKPVNCNPGTTCMPSAKDGALSWKLDTTTDRFGNYIRYAYAQDTATGEHKLSSIRYGGKNKPAHAAVHLEYQDRPDVWTRYIDQARNDQRTRLFRITTYVGADLDGTLPAGTRVRKYELAYDVSPTSGRSLLKSVTVAARNPQTGVDDVLPPTTFDWGKPAKTPGFAAPVAWANGPVLSVAKQNQDGSYHVTMHPELFAMADFGNDGRMDALQKSTYPLAYNPTQLAKEFPESAISLKNAYDYYHNNGSGFDKYSYTLSTGENFGVMDVADFNGDGAPDLLAWTAAGTGKICLSPLANAAPSGSSPIVFNCRPASEYAVTGSPDQPPLATDVIGDGRTALYGRINTSGSATLCIQGSCQEVWNPPVAAIGFNYANDGTREYHHHAYSEFTQSVDYGGVGKPYDTRMSRPYFLSKIYQDNDYIGYYKWVNLQPTITIAIAMAPGYEADSAPVASYVYPAYAPLGPWGAPPTQVDLRTPYSFEDGVKGLGGSGDFNGSGYSGLVFGFREHAWNSYVQSYGKAEMTLCASTGRELDCHVRKKYSTYGSIASTQSGTYGGAEQRMQYLAPIGVGNFIGDGQPNILARSMVQGANFPSHTGNVYVCRVMGDDNSTAGSNGLDDSNMQCDPWSGASLAGDLTHKDRGVFFYDMKGTGRTQIVHYTEDRSTPGINPTSFGWTVTEPIDMAADGQALDRIHSVTNGMGAVSSVEYADGAATGLVSRSGTANLQYPRHLSAGLGKYVRRSVTDNGVGAKRSHTYRYQDPAIDVTGRGSVPFGTFITTDEQTKFVTTNTYEQQAWQTSGMLLSSVVRTPDCTVPLSSQVNRLQARAITQANNATTWLPIVASSTASSADLTCTPLATVVTAGPNGAADVSYDNWGNLLGSEVKTSGDGKTYTTTTVNTYKPVDETNWLVGLVDVARVTKSQSGDAKVITREVAHTYEPVTGAPKSQTMQPNDATARMKLTTTFGRANNTFGLVDTKTTSWTDPFSGANQSTTETIGYDGNGRYPTTQTNALLHAKTLTYFEGTGAPMSATDPNGLTVTWETDGFGRVTLEKNLADGNEVRTARKQCAGDTLCAAGTAMVTVVERFNGGVRTAVPQMSFVDTVGHVLRNASYGTDGILGTDGQARVLPIMVDQYYGDHLGRLSRVDHPRFLGAAAFMAKFMTYDDMNRVTLTRTLDEAGAAADTTTDYAGWKTTSTNARTFKRIDERDALGRLVKVTDAKNGVTSFGYDAFSNLTKTTDPGNNNIDVTYDDLGRKIAMNDPDLGNITYLLDPRGLVRRQVTANHAALAGYSATAPADPTQDKAIRMEYDVLGRMTARYEPDLKSYWVFDKQPWAATCQGSKSCGQLVEAYTGSSASPDYRRTQAYDSKGRPAQVKQYLHDAQYTSTPAYDIWSRPVSVTYQRGTDAAKVFDQRYDDFGQLARIERQGLKLWESKKRNAAGQLLSEALGNGLLQTQVFNNYTGRLENATLASGSNGQRLTEGYTYDKLGSVATRTWGWDTALASEMFEYDELNRIKWSEVTGKTRQNFSYDAMGNIKSKTGVGTYDYPTSGAGVVRPHAVQRIVAANGVETNFTYDLNGNRTGAQGRTETWTSFDMPNELSKTVGGIAFTNKFIYGPEHQRTRQIKRENGVDKGMVIYAGAQEVEVTGSAVKVKTYWPMGLGVEIDAGGTTAMYWSHKDNLGSPIALSDASGNLQERMAYDVWGKRRTLDGAPDASGTPTPDNIDGVKDNRGFTGHEMLDQIDLVHMNGRVFDPFIGRFLSGDIVVEDPANGQAFNRYSYVLNNPTNLVDPSGYSSCPGQDKPCPEPEIKEEVRGRKESSAEGMIRSFTQYVIRAFMSGSVASGNLQIQVVAKKNGSDGNVRPNAKFSMSGVGAASSPANPRGISADSLMAGEAARLAEHRERMKRLWGAAEEHWRDKQIESGNQLYAIPGTLATMLSDDEHIEKLDIAIGIIGSVRGVGPRNGHLAGRVHPKTGVPFDRNGYPDFTALAKAQVTIVPTGSRAGDFRAANKEAGFKQTPEGYTWHHHQDGRTMQLVPREIHAQTGHTGGFTPGK